MPVSSVRSYSRPASPAHGADQRLGQAKKTLLDKRFSDRDADEILAIMRPFLSHADKDMHPDFSQYRPLTLNELKGRSMVEIRETVASTPDKHKSVVKVEVLGRGPAHHIFTLLTEHDIRTLLGHETGNVLRRAALGTINMRTACRTATW